MTEGQRPPERAAPLSKRERTKIEGRFGIILLLLIVAVFFSISAPEGPWAQLFVAVVLAATLSIAMLASGVRRKVVRVWLGVAVLGVGASIFIAIAQATRIASGDLALTNLLLTLITTGAIAHRLWRHTEISVLTVLGALCIYVLLGSSFTFMFQAVGTLGSQPFFASQENGTRSDYMYFSFITIATVGYGDLTPQGGLGRALAVLEGILGQIYLVTAVAAIVGNLGRTRDSSQEGNEASLKDNEGRNGC